MRSSTRRDRELALPRLFHGDRRRRGRESYLQRDPRHHHRDAVNIDAATAALSAAALGGTTPRRDGFAAATLLPPSLAATCCRVGLQTSCMGVRAMLNPGIPRPLTKIAGKPHSKKT